MEFIQWFSGSAVGVGEVPIDITRHAVFRLDAIDQVMMDKDTISLIKREDDQPGKNHIAYRIAEEDEEVYRKTCINMFSKLLSSYNTYDVLTDFTKK